MTIAVLGATGLVGRHVVETLSAGSAHRLVATHHVRAPFEAPRTTWVKCDLSDSEQASQVLQGVDTAVVCAGQLSTAAVLNRDPIGSVLNTLRVLTSVLEAAARRRLRRVVLLSSCTGYPPMSRPAVEADMEKGVPPDQWFGVGSMHRYVEQQLRWYVERLGLIGSAAVLRPTLVYGPYDDFASETGHFVPAMIRRVVERVRPIEIWGDGTQTRNLLHAGDLAQAIRGVLAERAERFEVFNVAAPDDASVNDVVKHLIELDGFSDAIVTRDPKRGGGPAALRVSAAALTAATGWRPEFDLRAGLENALLWYRRAHA
jgi:GDP-L-fucose synthase